MICDNYNCRKSYKAYLTKKASSIMHCETEKLNKDIPKCKDEKKSLKYNKFDSINLENNCEQNGSVPLISNDSILKSLINTYSINNLNKVKSNKSSCLIEDSPFYIHKVCYFFFFT
jgi:hypothetical protein